MTPEIMNLIAGGSPYALLLAAVWWFKSKLEQTEARLHERDDKRSLEVDQYVKIVERLAATLAENNMLFSEVRSTMNITNKAHERAELAFENMKKRASHESTRESLE